MDSGRVMLQGVGFRVKFEAWDLQASGLGLGAWEA